VSVETDRLRSAAYGAALRRLRAEFPQEQQHLLAAYRGANRSQKASLELRRRHPERAAELYREELTARGLTPGKAADRG